MTTHIPIGGRFAVIVAFLVASSGVVARAQKPPDRFAIVTITNKTPNTVRYRYNWGDSDKWYRIELKPAAYRWDSHEYRIPGQNRSPHFHIRFDSSLGADTSMKAYTLEKAAARFKDPDLGRHHDFKISADGHSIDIYKRASRSLNN
jgi:hypothetical protein